MPSGNFSSSNIVWSVEGKSSSGTTITGSGNQISGGNVSQTGTLTVAADETAATLTVKATYLSQAWTATVTVN
jgi:hypothetical protein